MYHVVINLATGVGSSSLLLQVSDCVASQTSGDVGAAAGWSELLSAPRAKLSMPVWGSEGAAAEYAVGDKALLGCDRVFLAGSDDALLGFDRVFLGGRTGRIGPAGTVSEGSAVTANSHFHHSHSNRFIFPYTL